ncbi:unnamed protein product [Penicillium roqueforti FM164]|uniref:Transposable element n=1 Tax=Penicillium roqueforti (strain FM164) TaxID=1365484 RepID=W6QWQ5_PENRF|nr:unnamed protein product [Penicillium roqueforti FM164]
MILLVLLFSGTSPTHRITAVESQVKQPVGTLKAPISKIHRPNLDLASVLPNLLAQIQSNLAPQRRDDCHILTRIEKLKRQGWPKLKRLSQAIYRNSNQISRLRAHLSFLQAELKKRISSRNGSLNAILYIQELTQDNLSPGRIYLIGSLLVQHYLEKWSKGPVDRNRIDVPGSTALLIDQIPSLYT